MPNSEHRSPVTVEDLLKLKRAERPAAAFWAEFDRELRQKQLAALMERRSWWQEIPRLFSRRVYLPAGVTAALAFTIMTVRYAAAPGAMVTGAAPVAQPMQPALPAMALTVATSEPATRVAVSSPLLNRREVTSLPVDDRQGISAQVTYASASAQPVLPMLTVSESQIEPTPSARSIAANLAQLEQSEPDLVNAVMGARLSTTARPVPANEVNAEFASLSNESARRNRLLASYGESQVTSPRAAPEGVRERLARRLSDLDDGGRFTRIGLKGDQVSLRF